MLSRWVLVALLQVASAAVASEAFTESERTATTDIVGIRLGMDPQAAKDALIAHNSKLGIREIASSISGVAGSDFLSAIYAQGQTEQGKEEFRIDFAPPPNGARVILVSRMVQYSKGTEPAKAVVIGALQQKYGESKTGMFNNPSNFDISWVDDPAGKRIQANREPCTRTSIYPRQGTNMAFSPDRTIPEQCGFAVYANVIGANMHNAATQDLTSALLVAMIDWNYLAHLQAQTRQHAQTKGNEQATSRGAPKL